MPHRLERISRALLPAPGFCDEELVAVKAFRPSSTGARHSRRKPDEDEEHSKTLAPSPSPMQD